MGAKPPPAHDGQPVPTGGPQFAEPTPTRDPTKFSVKHGSDRDAYTILDQEKGRLQPRPFRVVKGIDEPVLQLAEALGARVGDEIALRTFKPAFLSREAPLASRKEKDTRRSLLTVAAVLSDKELGRFSLKSDQAGNAAAGQWPPCIHQRLVVDDPSMCFGELVAGRPGRNDLCNDHIVQLTEQRSDILARKCAHGCLPNGGLSRNASPPG